MRNEHDKYVLGKVFEEERQITANNPDQETLKKSDKPYHDIVAFPTTAEVLLFKNKIYKVSAYIGFHSLHKRPAVYLFDIDVGPNITRAGVLDESWLKYNHQIEMLEIQIGSKTKLVTSGTITLHHCMGE